jgi:hypothetical protein
LHAPFVSGPVQVHTLTWKPLAALQQLPLHAFPEGALPPEEGAWQVAAHAPNLLQRSVGDNPFRDESVLQTVNPLEFNQYESEKVTANPVALALSAH